ncbi:MAG: alginate export family protein [Deltaproteobacteria bacterium]|nr:alginate export family protein [Deltaproteobacteria bacterium]
MTHLTNYLKLLWKEILLFLMILLSLCIISAPLISRASDLEESVEKFKNHVSGGVNIRLRNELWNTFEKQGVSTDRTYDFFLVRTRGFIDIFWNNFFLHVMGQGVKAFNLPRNGAFGPGPLYFSASDDDTGPGNFQIAEAYLQIKDFPVLGFYLTGGRIGFLDGAEVLYGEPKIDWVIKARLSERLIGNWDWVNIGRRFDGGTFGFGNRIFDLNVFGANVLQGGYDFDDGLWKELDHVVVVGGSFTLKKDVIVPGTQFKVFNYFYFDDRTPARELAGDDLEINTTGASIVGAYEVGPGQMDLLLWFAFQTGDFGDLDQKAFGFIGEIGYQFLQVPLKPWLRIGLAYASGDDDPDDSDHGTFFNMVPTNHKWYGYADAVAFSNLEDYYFQLILTPHSKVAFAIDGHLFRLASDDEFWISGSGPFNNEVFGYAFNKPVSGEDIKRNLGGELDFTLSIKPVDFLSLDIGYSHFFGAKGVEVVFDKEDQLDWFYVQTEISF